MSLAVRKSESLPSKSTPYERRSRGCCVGCAPSGGAPPGSAAPGASSKADKADAEARAAAESDGAERDKDTGGLLERLDLGDEKLRYFVFRSAAATGWFRRLLAYDLCAFVSIVLVFGSLHAWAWAEGLMTTGRQLREAVWWARCMYGLSALPYLIFSVPLLNRILTHTRPTGYDRDGRCVRKLSTPWKHRTTAPSRETGKGDAVDAAAAEPDKGSHEGSGADGGADAAGPYATMEPGALPTTDR